MTKVSEVRSSLRRLVLAKCASEADSPYQAYANAYKGTLLEGGTRIAANDAIRRGGAATRRQPQKTAPAPAPVASPSPAAGAVSRAKSWLKSKFTGLFR